MSVTYNGQLIENFIYNNTTVGSSTFYTQSELNSIGTACTNKGSTPTTNTPSDIVTAISNISTNKNFLTLFTDGSKENVNYTIYYLIDNKSYMFRFTSDGSNAYYNEYDFSNNTNTTSDYITNTQCFNRFNEIQSTITVGEYDNGAYFKINQAMNIVHLIAPVYNFGPNGNYPTSTSVSADYYITDYTLSTSSVIKKYPALAYGLLMFL